MEFLEIRKYIVDKRFDPHQTISALRKILRGLNAMRINIIEKLNTALHYYDKDNDVSFTVREIKK